MELRRIADKVRNRRRDFLVNPLTKSNPNEALLKYLWINFRLYVLNQEVDLTFLENVRCQIKKGDSITGNYFFNLYEYRDSLFVMHYLRPGDRFVDVGANVGHYALIAARKCAADVIAVEPVPDTFSRLAKNIVLNGLHGSGAGRIRAMNVGLSDAKGTLSFTTGFHTANHVDTEATSTSVEVEVLPLDELCEGECVRLLKIDVEGYEKHVLCGATKQLSSSSLDAIIIELNGSGRQFGVEDSEIMSLLEGHGYHPWSYDPFTRELTPLSENDEEAGYNTIYIKNVDRVRERVRLAQRSRIGSRLTL